MDQSNQESNRVAPTIPEQQHILNLEGFVRTLTEAPTAKPHKFSDQIFIVSAGGSTSLYLYDTLNLAWKYTTLT